MNAVEWIRFLLGAAFLLAGMAVFVIELIGVFRFKYVMNRMHAAALGDTLGIGCSLIGLMIFNGCNLSTLKLALVIVCFWFSSPVCSHLVARMEIGTDAETDRFFTRRDLREDAVDAADETEATAADRTEAASPDKEEK